MISSLRGVVSASTGTSCILEVAGVGYRATVTPAHSAQLHVGEQALIITALIVRDDALTLFGFESDEHLKVFELLTSVSSVGPKSAMAVLSVLSPGEVAAAVADENDAAFRAVPGIGTKTAKLIIVQLAGKLDVALADRSSQPAARAITGDVVVALVELGWSQKVASQTVDAIVESSAQSHTDVSSLLRLALAQLGPRR